MKKKRDNYFKKFIQAHCTIGREYTVSKLQAIYDDLSRRGEQPNFQRSSLRSSLRNQAEIVGMKPLPIMDYSVNTGQCGRKPRIFIYEGVTE